MYNALPAQVSFMRRGTVANPKHRHGPHAAKSPNTTRQHTTQSPNPHTRTPRPAYSEQIGETVSLATGWRARVCWPRPARLPGGPKVALRVWRLLESVLTSSGECQSVALPPPTRVEPCTTAPRTRGFVSTTLTRKWGAAHRCVPLVAPSGRCFIPLGCL